jgi:ABC-type cobalamin/Fe3+-siderophores transport systems, ATPase components
MDELLRAREVCAGYGQENVLRKVSFSVQAGELCALLGSNGSGKSTLLRCVCGLIPFRGSMTLEGEQLLHMSHRRRAQHVGYLSQKGGASPALTALDVVLMGFNPLLGLLQSPGSVHRGRALETLEQVGAAQFAYRDFPTLSEGQKQLVLLARTLVCQPRLIVLDEPDSALDFRNRRQILDLLKACSGARERGVLLCSHDINITLAYADHLLLLKDGSLAYDLRLSTVSQEQLQRALQDIYGPVEVLRHGGRYLMITRIEN